MKKGSHWRLEFFVSFSCKPIEDFHLRIELSCYCLFNDNNKWIFLSLKFYTYKEIITVIDPERGKSIR